MAEKKPLERYMDAGKEFNRDEPQAGPEGQRGSSSGRARAGREHAEDWADEFVQRGRRSAEQFADLVRKEIREQIQAVQPRDAHQDVIKVVQQFIRAHTKAAAPVMEAASRTVTATKKRNRA